MTKPMNWPGRDALPLAGAALEGQAIDLDALVIARIHASLPGRYAIDTVLGHGGMATVVRARDLTTGDLVALKAVRGDLVSDEETMQRAEREAEVATDLRHDRIVAVHDVHRLEPRGLVMVMELMVDGTLKERVKRGPVPMDTALQVLSDIASALAYAHERGVVHRDLKPDNVFLDNGGSRAKLGDFGIARVTTGHTLTVTCTIIGTPAYMSPEQIRGERVDLRSDLYSFGVVAWHLLTGAEPWSGESLVTVMHKQQHEALPSLRGLRLDVVPTVADVVEWCLRKDPRDRPASAREVLRALGGQAAVPPAPAGVQSVPGGATVRIERETVMGTPTPGGRGDTSREHRRALVGKVAFVAVLVAGAGGLLTRGREAPGPRTSVQTPPAAPPVAVAAVPVASDLAAGASTRLAALEGSLRTGEGDVLPLVHRDSLDVGAGNVLRLHYHGKACGACEFSDDVHPGRLHVTIGRVGQQVVRVLHVMATEVGEGTQRTFSEPRLLMSMGHPLFLVGTFARYGMSSTSFAFTTEIMAYSGAAQLAPVTVADPPTDSVARWQGLTDVSLTRAFADSTTPDGTFSRVYRLWREADASCCPSGGSLRVYFKVGLQGFEAKFLPMSFERVEALGVE